MALRPDAINQYNLRLVVVHRTTLAEGIALVRLAASDGHPLPAWELGAHIDLSLDNGLVRQYSLCGDPADTSTYDIAVLRERKSRGGSEYIHDALLEGAYVWAGRPRSAFKFKDARRYVFVAGGIGITPILPMVRHVASLGRPWSLHYGGRSHETMAFLPELAKYGSHVEIVSQEEHGLLDLTRILGTPLNDTLVYCCGPEALLTATENACSNWPPGSLRTERFAPRGEMKPQVERAFEVHLQRSGKTILVHPEESIMEAVNAAGVWTPSSCGEGTCGTCETGVLEGIPDHRDSVLDEDERAVNDCMMICVSRACGERLILDL